MEDSAFKGPCVLRGTPVGPLGPSLRHLDSPASGHHDACMRTTLTLDEDIARQLQEIARRSGTSFKEVVNTTLKKRLARGEKPGAKLPKFEVKPKACGFRSGIDVLRLNQLNDELEMEDFQRKLAAGQSSR